MGIVCTENWEGYSFQRGTASHRNFIVTGTTDRTAAINATGLTVNTPHPSDPRLKIRNDGFTCVDHGGPSTWLVGVDYGFPETGAYEPSTNPLAYEPVFKFDIGLSSEPSDTDANGNPLVNACGDAFSPPPQEEFKSLFFTLSQYEPNYRMDLALQYTDAVNSNAFQLFGYPGKIKAGQARVDSILPATDVKQSAQYIKVLYRVEIRSPLVNSKDGQYYSPFSTRLRNAGRTGFYASAGVVTRGLFCDTSGNPFPADTDLTETGLPFDKNVRVFGADQAVHLPVAAPAPYNLKIDPTQKTGPAAVRFNAGNGLPVIWLYYMGHNILDFKGIGIF